MSACFEKSRVNDAAQPLITLSDTVEASRFCIVILEKLIEIRFELEVVSKIRATPTCKPDVL